MKKYCLGFIFNEELDKILLMKKIHTPPNCPEMLNRLNGCGGSIEVGETPFQAMKRESFEEIGLLIENWVAFCNLTTKDKNAIIYCFYAVTNKIYDFQQKEEELLDIYGLNSHNSSIHGHFSNQYFYKHYARMNNLDYMIPMAINHYLKLDRAELFEIIEK